MIQIKKSPTADTRTCDFSKVTKEQLFQSSKQHIEDVREGLAYFRRLLSIIAVYHDYDKINDIDGFYRDFHIGFKQTTWWDHHRKISRHHLLFDDGTPDNVNLIDILEMITDCVMSGMGRSGKVYPVEISSGKLMKAFQNTVELLKNEVEVVEDETTKEN